MSVGARGAGRRWVAGSPSLSEFRFRYAEGATPDAPTRRPPVRSWTVGSEPIHVMITTLIMTWIGRSTERVGACSGWWDPKIVHSNAHESHTQVATTQPCAPPACLNRTPPRRARRREAAPRASAPRGSEPPGRRAAGAGSRQRRAGGGGGSFEILRVAAGVHGSRRTRGYAVMHQHAPCRMFDITHNTGGCGVPLNSHTPFHKPPAPRTNRHARTTMSSRRHVRSISSPLLYKPSGRLSKRAS